MYFNSIDYFLFLPAVWLTFYWTPDRYRWITLLLASIGFYAALDAPYLLVVLAAVAGISWRAGLAIVAAEVHHRTRIFWGAVAANLLLLSGMRFPFSEGLSFFLVQSPLLAIGVSYFIFQAISYLADIRLERIEPEPHFGHLLLSLAFFPKLMQGPIERSGDLLPQLKQPYAFAYENMRAGLLLFAWGLFKKVVIADRLALYVNTVYGDVTAQAGISLLLATYFYALQIYFDFSGYTDMALGTARLFNVRLTQNFNSPYLATTIADFWRRWHISFSRWILEYIFKPLQMSWRQGGNKGTAVALLVTFVVCGLWHGVSWGFVIWGVLHGVYMAAEVFWRPYQKRLHKTLRIEKTHFLRIWQTVLTFHLVCFSWVFFRAQSVGDAWYVVTHWWPDYGTVIRPFLAQQGSAELAVMIFGLLLAAVVGLGMRRGFVLWRMPLYIRWTVYLFLAIFIMIFHIDSNRPFIYFRF